MVPDIHLDPERLHGHGRRLAGVLDGLVPLPDLDDDTRAALASTEPGSVVLAELDRVRAELDRAAHELAGLTAALHAAATAATCADTESGDAFRRIAADLR